MTRCLLTATLAVAVSGCQTLSHDAPARIVDADTVSRTELQQVVNAALGTTVMLANNALTEASVLLIERAPPRTMQNQFPQGRIMEAPIRFQLVSNAGECILIDQRDQSRHSLQATHCELEQ